MCGGEDEVYMVEMRARMRCGMGAEVWYGSGVSVTGVSVSSHRRACGGSPEAGLLDVRRLVYYEGESLNDP